MKQADIKHFNIPVFIPERACPNRCIYCNQPTITGVKELPGLQEISAIITTHLATIDNSNSHVEIAFFGGNFTGIPINEQEEYLKTACSYIEKGFVKGVRISTRPDYINDTVLELLKQYGVTTIELGVQSLDDEVLNASGRGYTSADVTKTAHLIRAAGFSLGLQMMQGLPADTIEKSIQTAERIIRLGASNTRIYPVLVIKDTVLEDLYNSGTYTPLGLNEAVKWSKELCKIFIEARVNVLKIGLHPSHELMTDGNIIAGPFHQSYAELVYTELWSDLLNSMRFKAADHITIYTHPHDYNHAIGYGGKNKKALLKKFKTVKFRTNNALARYTFHVDYC